MKVPQPIKYLIVAILFFASGVWFVFIGYLPISTYPVAGEMTDFLPSQSDIQRILVDRGYNIGPDGIDGVIGTDSRDAWDLAKCDDYAKELMARVTTEQGNGVGQFGE